MIKKTIFIFVLATLLLSVPTLLALSEASTKAEESIKSAQSCLREMESRSLPTSRAQESLQEANQQYNAQISLEVSQKRSGRYDIVHSKSQETCDIKEAAYKAQDELQIFEETYQEISLEADLSGMDKEYNEIKESFNGERFEETIPLINDGYEKLSEIQASQTTVRLFYDTTSRNLKNFFISNWKQISIISLAALIALVIFWKTIKIIRIKKKIKKLEKRKETLNLLIGNLQKEYFSSKKISETEYKVKIEKFKNMIREVNRQIPLLKEGIRKLNKKEKLEQPPKIEKKEPADPVESKIKAIKVERKKATKIEKKQKRKGFFSFLSNPQRAQKRREEKERRVEEKNLDKKAKQKAKYFVALAKQDKKEKTKIGKLEARQKLHQSKPTIKTAQKAQESLVLAQIKNDKAKRKAEKLKIKSQKAQEKQKRREEKIKQISLKNLEKHKAKLAKKQERERKKAVRREAKKTYHSAITESIQKKDYKLKKRHVDKENKKEYKNYKRLEKIKQREAKRAAKQERKQIRRLQKAQKHGHIDPLALFRRK